MATNQVQAVARPAGWNWLGRFKWGYNFKNLNFLICKKIILAHTHKISNHLRTIIEMTFLGMANKNNNKNMRNANICTGIFGEVKERRIPVCPIRVHTVSSLMKQWCQASKQASCYCFTLGSSYALVVATLLFQVRPEWVLFAGRCPFWVSFSSSSFCCSLPLCQWIHFKKHSFSFGPKWKAFLGAGKILFQRNLSCFLVWPNRETRKLTRMETFKQAHSAAGRGNILLHWNHHQLPLGASMLLVRGTKWKFSF